jgi:antitoxin ParD1/3/4
MMGWFRIGECIHVKSLPVLLGWMSNKKESWMTVTLTPRLEALISEMLATGRYADADDVLEQGVRLLEERERRRRLRESVAEGFAAIERGEGVELTSDLWEEIEREADEADRQGRPIRPDVWRQINRLAQLESPQPM